MRKVIVNFSLPLFVAAVVVIGSGTAAAQDLGSGPGCSAIEGMLATAVQDGDYFTGRIGTTGVSGVNRNGKPADDSDADGFTDSLEECINDALVGYCVDIDDDDSTCISMVAGPTSGKKNNRQEFTVTFSDVANCCGVSQCSDQIDNDGDLYTDYPEDPNCVNYRDNDETN